jgi:hypothetical protein
VRVGEDTQGWGLFACDTLACCELLECKEIYRWQMEEKKNWALMVDAGFWS